MYGFGIPAADDTGGFFELGRAVAHCLLVDTGEGLALIDTGWGMRDCTDPSPPVRRFMDGSRSPRDLDETAYRQIEALGYDPADVKHIFLTHLHMDHAGGLPDFPAATVHVFADELEACLDRPTMLDWLTLAYRPEHRAHGPRWQPCTLQGDRWFGLDCAPPIRVGEAEFVFVPLPGHSRGHCGIALRVGDRWLLHCGDAYVYHRQVGLMQPYRHPCGKLAETIQSKMAKIPRRHWRRIRELKRLHGDRIQVFCAHDAQELRQCQMGEPGGSRTPLPG